MGTDKRERNSVLAETKGEHVTNRQLSPKEAKTAFIDSQMNFHCKTRKDKPTIYSGPLPAEDQTAVTNRHVNRPIRTQKVK